jgi:hypothetical protein
VEMIEPAPEGLNFSREAWAAMPAELRSEIIRTMRELRAGIETLSQVDAK